MADDAELLRRYIDAHSQAAFSELVQRHFNVVYFAALRQVGGDAHRAQDVAQLVFTRLAQKAAHLADRPSLAGWLYVSTRLAALQVMRGERRRATHEQEAQAMQTLPGESEAAIEWERLKPVIDDVLHELKERDREVVLLRFFHAQSFPEIGGSLGITADAARFRIERALTRMRTLLSRRGVVSASTAIALTFQANVMSPPGLATLVAAAAFSEAGTAGTVAGGLGLVNFMATAKTSLTALIAVLGATVCGEAVLAWSQTQDLRRLRDAETTLSAAPPIFSRPAVSAQPPAATSAGPGAITPSAAGKMTAEPAAAPPAHAEITIVSSPQPASAPKAIPPAANISQAFSRAMDDPAFRALLAVAQKSRLSIFYSPLFEDLALDPDHLDRFKELLVDKQQSVGDANRAALRAGAKQDAAYQGIAGAQRDIDADIQDLLGADGYARYRNYEATRGQRILVDQLQQSLSYTATPLSDEQASELIQALFKNSASSGLPTTTGLGAQVGAGIRERDLSAPISEQSLRVAEKLLSPAQVSALRQLQAQQQEQQVIAQRIRQYNAAIQPTPK
jgi:RNA polymerase sigma factor (sigma-70 family)